MVVSIILAIILFYLTVCLALGYWILTRAALQGTWLKLAGLIIGLVIITFATVLLFTATFYSVKHRRDYYKIPPINKITQTKTPQKLQGDVIQQPSSFGGRNQSRQYK